MPLQDANPTPSFGGLGLRGNWSPGMVPTEKIKHVIGRMEVSNAN